MVARIHFVPRISTIYGLLYKNKIIGLIDGDNIQVSANLKGSVLGVQPIRPFTCNS